MKGFSRIKILSVVGMILGTITLHPFVAEMEKVESAASVQSAELQDTSLLDDIKYFDSWIGVTSSVANIRTEPNINAPILLKAPGKSWFPVISHEGKWYKIQVGLEQTGWISDGIVQAKSVSNQLQLIKVKAETPLFTGPDLAFRSTGKTSEMIIFLPLLVNGNWVKIVSTKTGEISWITKDQISWEYGQSSVPHSMDAESNGILKGKTIIIDAGHGGKDEGAIGVKRLIRESDVNLAVANVLEQKLTAAGAKVILTRRINDQYVSLADRVKISNDNHADLFISIHQNMYLPDPKVKGVKTYYYNEDLSKELSQDIESQFVSPVPTGSKTNVMTYQDALYVLDQDERPSVLVEGCFLSNSSELERSIYPEFHERLSTGIYHGILQYYGLNS
ncbi:MAG TPA: N-acetylmuramoyl-L-alanine amidase [Bacillota bacterium]|nr:N-acetylmuramoyl-L-alanine amidase [Bacillota bacterium]